jgi:hypothetical protein
VNRAIQALLWLSLLLWSARAEAAKVIIVQPNRASPEVNETLSRLRGELLSLGVDVAIAERPDAPGVNASAPRAWVERLATERDPDAILDVGDAAPATVDVWVFERPLRKPAVSRVALEPGAENPSERLAIRAVEVLRSNLVEIDLAAKGRPPPTTTAAGPSATIAQVSSSEPSAPPGHLDVQAGAVLLTSLDGVGPAVMPLVRFGWSARSWLTLHGELAGFGSRPMVASTAGSARVSQQYAVVGACYCARAARAIEPNVALSVGGLRTALDGEADAPAEPHSVVSWSFLVDASLGAEVRLPRDYHLTLAAHLQIAEPYIAIHFVDTLVATSGRPNLLFSLTVGTWL